MGEWQPIADAPKDGPFLVWSPSLGVCLVKPYDDEADRLERYPEIINGSFAQQRVGTATTLYDDGSVDYDLVFDATLWQPLPEPPQ